jgi:hypothetical protein
VEFAAHVVTPHTVYQPATCAVYLDELVAVL